MQKAFKVLLLILMSFGLKAQTQFPLGLPNPNAPNNYSKQGYLQADKGFIFTERDTFCARYPTLIKHITDHKLYYTNGNCTQWYPLSSVSNITSFTFITNNLVEICTGTNNCDTFVTNITNQITQIIRDSIFTITQHDFLEGGIVSYAGSGLIYNVTPAIFTLQNGGTIYQAAGSSVTLPAADATFDRVDAIVVTASGNDSVLVGTASANPVYPQIDPSNEKFLTYITVYAGTTSPPQIITETIYDENTEWTGSSTGAAANFASAAQVYHLTKSTFKTWTNGNVLRWTRTSPISTNGYGLLTFYVYLPASIPNNTNVVVQFFNGAVAVGNPVTLIAAYGFSKTTVGLWQPIAIPSSILGLTGDVDRITYSFTKTNASGVYIDWVQLQGGISNQPADNFVTHTFRKAGTDSVFEVISGVAKFAFIDSTGGAGGGGAIGNQGSGFTLTNNGTDVKSLIAVGGTWDSTSNGGALTLTQGQTDWNQSDNTAFDYIKNKPSLSGSINNAGSAYRAVISNGTQIRSFNHDLTLTIDSLAAGELTFKVDTSQIATQYDNSLKLNISDTAAMLDPYKNKVDTIYRTPGKDSIQFYISGRYRAIKDSTGGAGGGGIDSVRKPLGSSTVKQYTGGVATFAFRATEYFSIKDYGADSTGVADATTNIQAAITAASVSGGIVLIPRGIYKTTATLTLRSSNVSIVGEGEGSKILATGDYGDIFNVQPTSTPTTAAQGITGIQFKNFYIESATAMTSGAAIYVKYSFNFLAQDMRIGTLDFVGTSPTIMTVYDGIKLQYESAAIITNCQIFIGHYGVYFEGLRIPASGAQLGNFYWDGLITGNTNIWGKYNSANYAAGSAGVYIAGGTGGVQIEQCAIAFFENGVRVKGNNRELFLGHGFAADDCGGAGIYITDSINIVQMSGSWSAGTAKSSMTPAYAFYLDSTVKSTDGYDASAVPRISITGGTLYSSKNGMYIGTGRVTLTGVSSYSHTTNNLVLGGNVVAASISGGRFTSLLNFSAAQPLIRGVIGLSDAGGAVFSIAQTYQTLTDAATIIYDISKGANAIVTLGGNRAISLGYNGASIANGASGTLIVKQDATGGRTLTLPNTPSKVINGGGGVVTLTGLANAIDILSWTFDGAALYWTVGYNFN